MFRVSKPSVDFGETDRVTPDRVTVQEGTPVAVAKWKVKLGQVGH